MASKYASLNSYADTGYVTSTFKSGLVHRRTFCTLYRKPSLFRFAFLSPHPFPPLAHLVTKHVVGFDGKEGYSLTTRPDDVQAIKEVTTLRLAIAGATGISSGSAHTIGRLLLPETEGVAVFDLVDPQLREETGIDGVEYYSIAARHPKGDDRELWIEKDTLLLRRVICSRETARAEEVREGIRVNEPLEQALFAA